jgi:hypothetical protein
VWQGGRGVWEGRGAAGGGHVAQYIDFMWSIFDK